MIPSLQFKVDFEPILKQLAQGEVRAVIYNDARSPYPPRSDFAYFWAVNDGRGGIAAKNCPRLRFFSRGKWWSPVAVGPAKAQRIRERAVEAIMPMVFSMAAHASATQAGLVAFVNEAAALAKHALIQFTPRRSGTLASKYRIEHAK